MPHAHVSQSQPSRSRAVDARELDDLLELDEHALEHLYRRARTPRLGDLSGDLRGRMLAVVGAPTPLAALARAWAGSDFFPWRGKSFSARDERRGEGINRVFSDRIRLFTFATSIDRSRAGEFDALQLDYDRPENPFFIRPIKDEVRELSPGVWLGQAWLAVGARPRLVLYFGLTNRRAA